MKYILYYYFYLSSTINTTISTTIYIHGDTLKAYVYDVGYIDWQIVKREKELINNGMLTGIYHVRYKDMKGIIDITPKVTECIIMVDNKTEHIYLRPNRRIYGHQITQ